MSCFSEHGSVVMTDENGDYKIMAIRYNEEGGIPGYRWVSLPDVKIGDTVYFQGHDVRVVGIRTTEHPFTRTEPIVQVIGVDLLRPDSFQCESPTAYLLIKES